MNNVNKTLYIPLYGKAFVSRKGIILHDPKAEEIWEKEGFPLKGKSKSKWLAYYMGMRSAVFDKWLKEKMIEDSGAVVLHIGCGMDSRILRVGSKMHQWYDVDFPDVIAERKRYFAETGEYHMLAGDARETDFLQTLPAGKNAIVVLEGISMYLAPAELQQLFSALSEHFSTVSILMDCYTKAAAKASKYKNPINDVGVTAVHGMDEPTLPMENTGLHFVKEHEMTPAVLIAQLRGTERSVFKKVFAGKFAKRMYRMYEYEK